MMDNNSLSPEEEEELINKVAKKIADSGMEMAAKIFFESIKPISILGGQFARLFAYPYLSIFGETGVMGHKLIEVFEKRENIEKLLEKLDKLTEG